MKRIALTLLFLLFACEAGCAQSPDSPAVVQKDWSGAWGGYFVAPWRFKTPPLNDATAKQWHAQGLTAIHIDKNYDPAEVAWARANNFDLYLDHAAGKGILYLRERKELVGKRPAEKWRVGPGMLLKRPRCLHDPEAIAELEANVRRHVAGVRDASVHCYSLDDEISTGNFLSMVETCWGEHTRPVFRKWALGRYGSLDALNKAWGTDFAAVDDITPSDPGYAIAMAREKPIGEWNFSRWADWREFMDMTLADTVAGLVNLGHKLDPRAPFGIEGAQAPGAYGGYDYSRLCRSLQWIENYDYGDNDEIIRSLAPAVVRAKTFFSRQDKARDSWKLWYHFAHGNRGAILWPAAGEEGSWYNADATLKESFRHLPPIFKELTGERMRSLLAGAEFQDSGVAIYYSQPSIRAAWILDATVHRDGSWAARSGGVDQASSTSYFSRAAWVAMLEDAQLQYNFIDAGKLGAGELKFPRYKVLILPACIAMSDAEGEAVMAFKKAGGTVIADYLPGFLIERCRARSDREFIGPLFGGKTQTYLNGEAYRKPLAERFIADGVPHENGWPVIHGEKGFLNPDRSVLVNLFPAPYLLNRAAGKRDANARKVLEIVRDAGVRPAVTVRTAGAFNEVIRWRNDGREYLCVVKNPKIHVGGVKGAWERAGISDKPQRLVLEFRTVQPAGAVVDARTGKELPVSAAGEDGVPRVMADWVPCEAAIFSYPVK